MNTAPTEICPELTLRQLADAINAKTGANMRPAAEMAAERKAKRNAVMVERQRAADAEYDAKVAEIKRQRRAQEESDLDDAMCGEIRSAIGAGDHVEALNLTHELWSEHLKARHLRAITHYFKLADCPCCSGAYSQSWISGDGQDADWNCPVCTYGLATQEAAEEYRREDATHIAEQREHWVAAH